MSLLWSYKQLELPSPLSTNHLKMKKRVPLPPFYHVDSWLKRLCMFHYMSCGVGTCIKSCHLGNKTSLNILSLSRKYSSCWWNVVWYYNAGKTWQKCKNLMFWKYNNPLNFLMGIKYGIFCLSAKFIKCVFLIKLLRNTNEFVFVWRCFP